MIKWIKTIVTIILRPISILLYSLTDFRWLTFYIIVLSKLFVNLCKREDEREYYENYNKETDDDEEEYEEQEDEDSEHETNGKTME